MIRTNRKKNIGKLVKIKIKIKQNPLFANGTARHGRKRETGCEKTGRERLQN